MTAIFRAVLLVSCLWAAPFYAANSPSVNENYDYDRLQPDHLSPVIVTEPVTVTANPGETHTLYCDVTRLGDHSLTWRRGSDIISVFKGKHHQRVLKDRRYLPTNSNLTLFNVVGSDSGLYTCEVTTRPHPTTLTHTLKVNELPSINATHPRLTPKEGGTATLECSFRGDPPITVTWRKHDHSNPSSLPLLGATTVGSVSELVLTNVTRQDSGSYRCSASNSIGHTANASMDLAVMHAPVVTVEKAVVHTGVGENAVLMCRVSAHPSAKVKWQHGDTGAPVNPMRLKRQHKSKDRRYLHFNPVLLRDFGPYVCAASNQLGNDQGRVTLSATPKAPEVISDNYTNHTTLYTLLWEVESFAPILHYIINIRNATDLEEDSLNITVPGYQHSQYANYHSQKKEFTNLQPNTRYVVNIVAVNEFGDNSLESPFTFMTASEDEDYPDAAILDSDHSGLDSSFDIYDEEGDYEDAYNHEDDYSGVIDYYGGKNDGGELRQRKQHRHQHHWQQQHQHHHRGQTTDNEGSFNAERGPEQQQQRGHAPANSVDLPPGPDDGNMTESPPDTASPAPPLSPYPNLGPWLTVVVLSAFFC